jgi:hypothetical protein
VTGLTTLNVVTGTADVDAKRITTVNLAVSVPLVISDLSALVTAYATVATAQNAQDVVSRFLTISSSF